MVRWVLLAAFALVLAAATALVLAANYLPWWGFALTLAALAVGGWAFGKYLAGRLFLALFSLPFRAKGAVLRDATVKVHAVTPSGPPETPDAGDGDGRDGDGDGDDDGPPPDLAWYELDVTITPAGAATPFRFWEPDELRLIPASARLAPFGGDEPEGASVEVTGLFAEGAFQPLEDAKYHGPQRLRLRVGVPPGLERRLAFAYYFEKFGTVTLPPAADAGAGPVRPESTRP